MKKIIKICTASILAAALCLGVAACSEFDLAGEGTAYGLVHSHYVGIVTLKTDADGKITAAAFDEMQLPYNWAVMSSFKDNDAADFDGAAFRDEDLEASKRYAKAIMIGGKTFTALSTAAKGAYPDYQLAEANNGVTLENWLKDGLNAKWYVTQMKQGNYGVMKSAGGVLNEFTDASTGSLGLGDRWLKSKNGYWSASMGIGLGWKGNMDKLSEYLIGNGFAEDGLTLKGEDKIWSVNGTATGATLTDFNDYMALARIAYGMATVQKG